MRGRLALDPARCENGPATAAIRRSLRTWIDIDWFASRDGSSAHATSLFHEHHALGRACSPSLFAETVTIRSVLGGWGDFAALCARVRSDTAWDWKYSVLKRLTREHSTALGWTLESGATDPELFVRIGQHVFWKPLVPALDLAALGAVHADEARFYTSYAAMDLMDAIEWQLADGSEDATRNPFVPLLECYAAGFCPFALGPGSVVLFGFDGRPA